MSRSLIYLIISTCCLKAIILRQVCFAFSVIELWMQNTCKRKGLVRSGGLDAAEALSPLFPRQAAAKVNKQAHQLQLMNDRP